MRVISTTLNERSLCEVETATFRFLLYITPPFVRLDSFNSLLYNISMVWRSDG